MFARRGARLGAVLAVSAATVLCAGPRAATGVTADPVADVAVAADSGLATVPDSAVGMNTAVYDGYLSDPPVPGLLRAAGIDALRYPGGSYSDIFDWQTNTATGGYVAPHTTFADFMTLAGATGAHPVITVDYGSGTPDQAAAWVRQANVTDHDGIRYWEIGNEIYGNGYYGAQWETDNHADRSPTGYATNWLAYESAMKAVDPSVQVGAVLTTPGYWPDGVVGSGSTMDWNHTVLSILGAHVDFVIVHYYPGGSTAANLLAAPSNIAGIVSTLRALLNQYAGAKAAGVGIVVTETNSTIDMDTQPAALFAADSVTAWLEHGAGTVDWWNLHNGANSPTTVDGVTDYGDQGVLSNGSSSNGITEPAAETPFAGYYGLRMLSYFGGPGGELVGVNSDRSLVRAHAVRRPDGSLAVLLVNTDPSNAYTVRLSYTGFTPAAGPPTVYTFADNATSITSASTGSAATRTVSPYSVSVVVLRPA
jgi:hypothetical protein